jgi:beta-glucuronidase
MTEDPFAHLHDEGYEAATATPLATAGDLVAIGGRRRISLDGEWSFTPDLFDEGLRQRWYADDATGPEHWTVPRDRDPDGADTIPVPACWTCVRPEWRYFEGAAWYQRAFEWQIDAAVPRLMLRVGAANYAARVFLNGQFLAAHRGASTPFCVELTRSLRPGQNQLLIQVDNRRRPERVPMHHFDWFNDGGIYREVDLLPLPQTFIRQFKAALVTEGVELQIAMSDPVDGVAMVRIDGLLEAYKLPVEAGTGRVVLPLAPERWTPDRPRLYDVEARFGEDMVRDRIGFRTLRTDGERILLNDQPLQLRGICVHEDDIVTGRMTNDADLRRRFAHARELGCNFLRLAHYPHHERAAELADELGIMLWAEIPVYWAIDFANPSTYADAENQLLEMITRDANRASVILWGVGNENADTDARYHFMQRLARAARATDPTRLVTAACLINRTNFRIEDRLAAELDVVGLNEYFGWYEPDMAGLERLLCNSAPGKPVIIAETGADAVAGMHGDPTMLFSEEKQAAVYREQIAIISKHSYVAGFCPWLLYDFRSERRQTRFQRGINRKGLIAEDKTTKKLAFAILAAHYGTSGTS